MTGLIQFVTTHPWETVFWFAIVVDVILFLSACWSNIQVEETEKH